MPPDDVLRAFFAAMNEWERAAWDIYTPSAPGFDYAVFAELILASQQAVFKKYCTPKKRPYGRAGSLSDPVTYDPLTEVIESVTYESPRRARIRTRTQDRFGVGCDYVLLKQGGRWLVDSKRRRWADGSETRDVL